MGEAAVQSELEVVGAFLGALERLDIDAAVELLDPDVVYQNVPYPAARGVRAVERQLRGLARYSNGFEARVHHIAADRAVVLTERTDVLVLGQLRAEFWVCGTFEVHDGRITVWRDRFDHLDLLWAFVRGAVRALVSGRR